MAGVTITDARHRFIQVEHPKKTEALVRELAADRGLTLVFVQTRHGADRLARNLRRQGFRAGELHGGKKKVIGRIQSCQLAIGEDREHTSLVACAPSTGPPLPNAVFVGDAHPPGRSGTSTSGGEMATSDFEGAIQEARAALEMIVKGDAEGYKALLSDSEEITLANPFGGIAHGRDEVIETLDRAASNFRDGHTTGFETIERLVTPDLAYTLEIERYVAKVGGSSDLSDVALRVSCMYRLEGGVWKLLHRHADPRVGPQTPESLIQS